MTVLTFTWANEIRPAIVEAVTVAQRYAAWLTQKVLSQADDLALVGLAFSAISIAIDKGGGVEGALHHPVVLGHTLIIFIVNESLNDNLLAVSGVDRNRFHA